MMKFLLLLTLITLVVGDYTKEMMKQWERMKALESCWGEENMKLYTVNLKKAIATCNHHDAPELFLPPFRSSYRFVNTMLNGANKMENEKYDFMEKMFFMMRHQDDRHQNKYNVYTPYSSDYSSMNKDNDNWMEKMKMRFRMKQMMEKMDNMGSSVVSSYRNDDHKDSFNNDEMFRMFTNMFGDNMNEKMDYSSKHNNYRKNDPMARMSEFMEMFSSNSRSKRAAGQPKAGVTPSLDLGDRLVEKLNEQKRHMEEKVGNMTCVMREMNYIDTNNKLDLRAMKKDIEQYTMPSPWFAQRYEEVVEMCYEMATNLPTEIEENAIVTGEGFGTVNLAEIKSFKQCCSKAETRLCMNQDIKKKIESNFGPLEDILSQTKLTEYQIFPLVIQLLHGEEMQYMVGDF